MKNTWILLLKRLSTLLAFLIVLLSVFDYAYDSDPASANAAMDMEASEGVKLPVIMYHSLLQDPARSGPYTVTPALFEQDLTYLKNHGYTSVTPYELVAYTQGHGDLPEKPVLITFDDGFYNNLVYGLPILKKLDMHAVISVIGSETERFSNSDDRSPGHAYLTWEDIRALQDSGYVDIGNHTYDLHKMNDGNYGVKRRPGQSAELHRATLLVDIGGLQASIQEHCGFMPIVFAYPFGQRDAQAEVALRDLGFLMLLTSYERVNIITRDPQCLYKLGRFNRPAGISPEAFMKKALGELSPT